MNFKTLSDSDFDLEHYDYQLPESLIAERPCESRSDSRLLVYYQQEDRIEHRSFHQLDQILSAQDHLVFNHSKVFPCRLRGHRPSGGKAELFILSLTPIEKEKLTLYPCLLKSKGNKQKGEEWIFHGHKVSVHSRQEEIFWINFGLSPSQLQAFLNQYGQVPIPPYIRKGESDHLDKEQYQTVYAKNYGSVAAPTAGLHFDDLLFAKLAAKKINHSYLTLHVGMGTFASVKSPDIRHHQMHREQYFFEHDHLTDLQAAYAQKKRIIAVGTTSLRALETSYQKSRALAETLADHPYQTDIFIYPGKNVASIDGLITNFHLPKSSLIMLVSALIGREKTLELYQTAIENKYRFYSYGDAMMIIRGDQS